MKINVINENPNVNITVNKKDDGSYEILVAENEKKTLGSCVPGSVVKLGNREYIVLGHGEETTAVITKEFATKMEYGETGDYEKSNVREYCTNKFYKELCKVVGKENIISHTVKLVSDDGTNKGATVKDNVSILTAELYRRYREFLPAYGDWWWTSTRVTTADDAYARDVCCVNSYGFLSWYDCGCCSGVRPFCILRSSILVS